jgi:hypothetical protein
MKCSENANYLEYMDHYARANYGAARVALSRYLEEVRSGPQDRIEESYLLHRLGTLFFLEGNIPEALRANPRKRKACNDWADDQFHRCIKGQPREPFRL